MQLDLGFPPAGGEQFDLAARCAGKKVLLLGLPGAFTPC
jgi:peroxiredoxin